MKGKEKEKREGTGNKVGEGGGKNWGSVGIGGGGRSVERSSQCGG